MLRPQLGIPAGSPGTDLRAWREQALTIVLRAMLVAGSVAGAGMAYAAYSDDRLWQIPFLIGAYGLLAAAALWQRAPFTVRVSVLLFVLYGTGVGALMLSGSAGVGLCVLLAVPLLAELFSGRRAALGWVGLAIGALLAIGGLMLSGRLVVAPSQAVSAGEWTGWMTGGLVYAALALLVFLPGDYLQRRLIRGLREGERLARELASERTGLQLQVAERTMDLELRAQYLEAITELTHSATAILDDPQELLERVVDLISERLAFYHTGVLLVDRDRTWVELRAASSEEGQRMLAQGYRLPLSGDGIVGQVATAGVAQVARDIGDRAPDPGSPYLTSTRSEIALPLRVHGETVGVLDVHSTEPAAFSDVDVAVLQILADQVAVALSNARLFRQVQDSVEAMRKAYGEMGLEAWHALLRSGGAIGVRHDPDRALAASDLSGIAHRARRTGKPVVGEAGRGVAAVPIKVRGGHVIGTANALKPEGEEWRAEELELLALLVDQLGVALDGAQLYQESQQRAERERLVAEISARMRETLNIDIVLRTAIREIGEVLGLAEVEVRMKGEEEAER
jgi:GAF domain-containing protein